MNSPSLHQDSPKVPECERPPKGWCCTRAADHDGPCAAVPVGGFATDDLDRPSHGQVWLDKESGFTVGVLNVSGDGPTVSGRWHRSLGPYDGFAFPLPEFTARFLPLAVDPSCISYIPISALLSDEVVVEAYREAGRGASVFEDDTDPDYIDLISDAAVQAAIEQVGGTR